MVVSDKAVVRYGALQAPWEMLVSAASAAHLPDVSAALPMESAKVLQYFARQVQIFERLREKWRVSGGAPLLTLLQDFSARRSTDERDKVYALQGIVTPDQRAMIEPDYTASVPEVYRATTISLIRQSGTLNVWCGDLARKSRQDIQSYVPDWSAVYDEFDRRRAQAEPVHDVCGLWKIHIISKQNQYWKFVRQGMEQLLGWLQSQKDAALPIILRTPVSDYADRLRESWLSGGAEPDLYALLTLCKQLEVFCSLGDAEARGFPWTARLFRCSAAFYGDMTTRLLNKGLWLNNLKGSGDYPLLAQIYDGGSESKYLPPISIPTLFIPREWDNSETIFSVQSIFKGTIWSRCSRLFTWAEIDSAFSTLKQWVSVWEGSWLNYIFDSDRYWIAVTLVAGHQWSRNTWTGKPNETEKSRLRRWYDRITAMCKGGDRSGFLNNEKMRHLDEALALATEGRVLFLTRSPNRGLSSLVGLGPASLAVGDEVRVMPCGRNNIVLRPLGAGRMACSLGTINGTEICRHWRLLSQCRD